MHRRIQRNYNAHFSLTTLLKTSVKCCISFSDGAKATPGASFFDDIVKQLRTPLMDREGTKNDGIASNSSKSTDQPSGEMFV